MGVHQVFPRVVTDDTHLPYEERCPRGRSSVPYEERCSRGRGGSSEVRNRHSAVIGRQGCARGSGRRDRLSAESPWRWLIILHYHPLYRRHRGDGSLRRAVGPAADPRAAAGAGEDDLGGGGNRVDDRHAQRGTRAERGCGSETPSTQCEEVRERDRERMTWAEDTKAVAARSFVGAVL